MKRIILTLTLIMGVFKLFAQDDFKNRMEYIFQNVNRSQVTTGLLEDYGIAFANISKHNGQLSDSNHVAYQEWRAVYNTLFTMRFRVMAA